MRIGSHIALQITALVLTGAGLSSVITHQTSTALEAREQIGADAEQRESFERFADVLGHLVLTGDLVLGGGTTYLVPVAERQARILQEIVSDLGSSPLLDHRTLDFDDLASDVGLLIEVIVQAQSVEGDDRDSVLYELLERFDELSEHVTSHVDELRVVVASSVRDRRAAAEAKVAEARSLSRAATLAFLVIILASWTYLIRATSRPIRLLAERARTARDDGRFESLGHGPEEVRELSSGFASLVDGLERSREGLEDVVALRTAELERALQARAAFLANTSHELRTPMNAILGFASLLEDDSDDPTRRREYVHNISTSGRHLLALIEEVLDLSKIDAGRMEVERIPMSPARLVEEIDSMLAQAARDKGLELSVELALDVPAFVLGDPIRTRQILVNLAGNAIKFTEAGRVRIEIEWSDDVLHASVEDTGIGIPHDKLEAVFAEFEQVDASATRRFGGTGLGLAISRRLARLMGGDVTVESEEGVGSTFRVELRAPAAQQRDVGVVDDRGADDPEPSPVAGSRVLLVDDVATNRLLGRRILERLDVAVLEAGDGRRAVETVYPDADGEEPIDAVLMDLQMPVMDGYEATRALRERGFRGPIIALSAAVLSEQRQLAIDCGCDDFVAKPFDASQLETTLGRLLAERPSRAA